MDRMQIGVLYGSRSCEHEVSVISAVQLMKAADPERYEIVPIYISMSGEWFSGAPLLDMKTYHNFDAYQAGLVRVWLDTAAGSGALMTIDPPKGMFGKEKQRLVARLKCVIPVLARHARGGRHPAGNAGDVQHSRTRAPAWRPPPSAWTRVYMKDFFKGCGFPVLDSCRALRSQWETDAQQVIGSIEDTLAYPVFVKPASLGSSIGVSKASNQEELQESLELAFEFDRKVLIEKGLNNPLELNCSVLGYNDDATASEIEMPVTGGDLLSFMDKYLQGEKRVPRAWRPSSASCPRRSNRNSRREYKACPSIFSSVWTVKASCASTLCTIPRPTGSILPKSTPFPARLRFTCGRESGVQIWGADRPDGPMRSKRMKKRTTAITLSPPIFSRKRRWARNTENSAQSSDKGDLRIGAFDN